MKKIICTILVVSLFPVNVAFAQTKTIQTASSDSVVVDKTIPYVKFQKWGSEVSLGIMPDDSLSYSSSDLNTSTTTWTKSGETIELSRLNNDFAFDIKFNSKPATSTFTFALDNWANLDFYYQPPLTEEKFSASEQKSIASCTETDCFDLKGRVLVHRPDNVVGSYVIYSKTKTGNQFQTGKVGNIYRPLLTDGSGNKSWGILAYNNGNLSVTIPDSVYNDPKTDWSNFTLDPTFGYTTIGGTSGSFGSFLHCTQFTTTEAGTVTTMSTYSDVAPNPQAQAAAIYTNSSAHPNTKLAEDSGNITVSSLGWHDNNISASLTASTIYWLCNWQDGSLNYYYDAAAAGTAMDKGGATFETWPTITSNDDSYARKYSIYATYTTSGATTILPRLILVGGGIYVRSTVIIQ